MNIVLRLAVSAICLTTLSGCVVALGVAANAAGAKPTWIGQGSDAAKPGGGIQPPPPAAETLSATK
jgi:hypothetical protein